jgi:branched-chain amino acid transport system substrate-binding protein
MNATGCRIGRVAITGLVVLAALAAGCEQKRNQTGNHSQSGSSTGTGGSVPQTGPILVGHFASMTGSEATFGQSTHNGIVLAVKEINAAGGINGRKVEVKVYDDQGRAQEAGTAVTRLITDDKVTAVLGEVASSLSIAGGRVAQQYHVPMITPSSTNPQVTAVGDKIFRVCFVDSFQASVLARYVREKLGLTNVAILYDQSQPYSKGLKTDFVTELEKRGGKIVVEQAYTGGDQEVSAQLTTIREAKPELLFIPGYYTDGANVAIQARKLGLEVPLLGADGWSSPQLVAIGGKTVEGATYSDHYSNDDERPEVKTFVAKFRARYGQPPSDVLAALGYDSARVLFDAMGRADSLSGEALAKALAATHDHHGVTGILTMDEKRNPRKSAVIVQIRDGKPRWVATISP